MDKITTFIRLLLQFKYNLTNMDIKQNLSYRYDDLRKYNACGNNKYDYATHGILNKVLPKILFKGNSILVTFLQLIDLRLIMIMKYIDRLKSFKYISRY
jgi:hypothetical protein